MRPGVDERVEGGGVWAVGVRMVVEEAVGDVLVGGPFVVCDEEAWVGAVRGGDGRWVRGLDSGFLRGSCATS